MAWPRSRSVGRHPQNVSPSTLSLSVRINGTPALVFDAPPSGAPLMQTISFDAPVGNDGFLIQLYDKTGATGNLLGRATLAATIVPGSNTIAPVFDGMLANILVTAASPFTEGSAAAGFALVGDTLQGIVLTPLDADGNSILAPGAVPTLTLTSGGSGVAIVSNIGNTYALQAAAPAAAQTLTATGKNLDGKTVQAAFGVAASAAIYVANFRTQTISAYDESGVQVMLPSGAFTGLRNPQGLLYVPGAAPGAGTLYAVDPSDNTVFAYDQVGNGAGLPAAAFGGTSQPFFPAYVAGTGKIFIPNYLSSTISAFDRNGNGLPSGPFPMLSQPISIAYDAHNANLYVVNLGSDHLNRFDLSGAAVGTPAVAGPQPMGVAFDSSNNRLYIADSGYPVVAPPATQTPAPSTVTVFDETPAAITSTMGSWSGLSNAVGIAFDPFNKRLYVTDAGLNTTLAFTEAGASVLLPGGFKNQTTPEGIVIVP